MKQTKKFQKDSFMRKWFYVLILILAFTMPSGMAEAKEKKQTGLVKDQLEVHYIDVGQGDATLIKCGDSAMLIDAGDNSKGTLVQNYLKKQNITKLDYMIVTHPHEDHLGGADVIVTKYDIDQIIMPNYKVATAAYRDLIQAMDDRRMKPAEPVVGNTYQLGEARFTILSPNKKDYGDNCNNYSVGILLEHGDKRFVFTGDAEEEAEKDILGNGISLSADVLKAGHHGSKTSSSEKFIKAVSPQYAVVSCEENNEYGMPHAAVLNTLRSNNIKLFRTDEQGSLIATSDGKEIKWNAAPTTTWKAGEPTKSAAVNQSEKPAPAVEKQQEPAVKKQPAPAVEKQQEPAQEIEEPAPQPKEESGQSYVLNTKTKKFHKTTCGSLPTTNRSDTAQSREEIIGQGYEACKKCKP